MSPKFKYVFPLLIISDINITLTPTHNISPPPPTHTLKKFEKFVFIFSMNTLIEPIDAHRGGRVGKREGGGKALTSSGKNAKKREN